MSYTKTLSSEEKLAVFVRDFGHKFKLTEPEPKESTPLVERPLSQEHIDKVIKDLVNKFKLDLKQAISYSQNSGDFFINNEIQYQDILFNLVNQINDKFLTEFIKLHETDIILSDKAWDDYYDYSQRPDKNERIENKLKNKHSELNRNTMYFENYFDYYGVDTINESIKTQMRDLMFIMDNREGKIEITNSIEFIINYHYRWCSWGSMEMPSKQKKLIEKYNLQFYTV